MNCESKKYRRIVVKIGSNVLTREDGRPDTTRISALVDQLARLHRAGTEFILVSSGAVASGRSLLETRVGRIDTVSARQLFSAVGQVKLLNRYYDLFNEYGIVCGQVLTTKESLSTRRQYLNQRNCMVTMLANGVLPIVNENDTISVTELMFTDNDELSGLVAAMMNAEALIILSNIDGIYDGSPADPASQVIRRVKPSEDLSQYIDPVRSSRGRGGMATKSRVSSRAAAEGIEVIIANGRRDGILTDLVLAAKDVPCTRFEPAPRAASGVKKWIASSEGFAKGILRIDQGAAEAVRASKAASILAVGVTAVEGDFERDDLVRILTEPRNALVKQYTKMFEFEDSTLEFEKDALRAIAHEAQEHGTGARGLRSICERVLQDVMYDLPEHKVATHVVVRASDITGETVPEIVPAS